MSDDSTLISQPVAVLIASGRNLDQWPISRVETPIQFQSIDGSPSRFQLALQALDKLGWETPPVIVLPSCALEIAERQLASFGGSHSARFIVEPVDRGSLQSASLAALKVSEIYPASTMVMIDLSAPINWDAVSRVVGQTLAENVGGRHLITCGNPMEDNAPPNAADVVKTAKTASNHLFRHTKSQGQQEKRFRLGLVTIGSATTFLELLDRNAPSVHRQASAAFKTAVEINGWIWPNIDIYSLLPFADLGDYLSENSSRTRLRPVEISVVESNSDQRQVYEENCVGCDATSSGPLLAISGCQDLTVVATSDAVLISHKNDPAGRRALIERLKIDERRELFEFTQRTFTWGEEVELQRSNRFSIVRTTVEPGHSIPTHFHRNQKQGWSVVSGKGEASVGDTTQTLEPGVCFSAEQSEPHGIRNTGNAPLIVVETRTGSEISESDFHLADHQTEGDQKLIELKSPALLRYLYDQEPNAQLQKTTSVQQTGQQSMKPLREPAITGRLPSPSVMMPIR